tara:strand:+ start:332 stop:562 length:231 start_codon:yes stop_codon:yes gene_type:complete
MGVFKNKKHTSRLYKVVKDACYSKPIVTTGDGKKQSKEMARGERVYNPALKREENQGLAIKGTIDRMIAKAVGKGA